MRFVMWAVAFIWLGIAVVFFLIVLNGVREGSIP